MGIGLYVKNFLLYFLTSFAFCYRLKNFQNLTTAAHPSNTTANCYFRKDLSILLLLYLSFASQFKIFNLKQVLNNMNKTK